MNEKSWHRLGALANLPSATPAGKNVGGRSLVLVRLEDEVFAFEDRCPHAGAPLSDGKLRLEYLTCRHHQWQFDVRTGASVRPRGSRLKTYPVKIEDGDVFVEI